MNKKFIYLDSVTLVCQMDLLIMFMQIQKIIKNHTSLQHTMETGEDKQNKQLGIIQELNFLE